MNQTEITIVEYSPTEAALSELRTRIGGAHYEVTTTEGMDHARRDRRELVTLRTTLEKKRVEVKAPAWAHCQMIDSEAKRITAEIVKLEKPIDELIKTEEKRKEEIKAEAARKEQERLDAIMERINKIKGAPDKAIGMTAAALSEAVAVFRSMEIGLEYQEFQERVVAIKNEVLVELERILTEKVEAERIVEAERAERERLEAEEKERRRLEDEERERQRLENEAEAERIRLEREKFEAEKAESNRLKEEEEKRLQAIRDEEDNQRRVQKEAEEAELQRQRDELKRQQDQMAETLRLQEEEKERERLAKETEDRKAATPETSDDIILRNCGAVGWLGICGDYRTGKHYPEAVDALNQVLKQIEAGF